MLRPVRSDRSSDGLVKRFDVIRARARLDREGGQAMVEFGLVLAPLLLLVSGIIWFGIGLNFWLDMNRIANQGARFAAVNCGPGTSPPACTPDLQTWITRQTLSRGNNPSVSICYQSPLTGSGGTKPTTGDAVTVRLKQPFNIVPLLNIRIDLKASTTMRLEQVPSKGGLTVPPLGVCSSTW
jgi:TadE-like protein